MRRQPPAPDPSSAAEIRPAAKEVDGVPRSCVHDAPGPEAIRRAAERNGLPVERITRVMVLDPYFYAPSSADDDVAAPSLPSAAAASTGRRASVEASTVHRQNDR